MWHSLILHHGETTPPHSQFLHKIHQQDTDVQRKNNLTSWKQELKKKKYTRGAHVQFQLQTIITESDSPILFPLCFEQLMVQEKQSAEEKYILFIFELLWQV